MGISTGSAVVLSSLYTLSYLGSIYIFKATRIDSTPPPPAAADASTPTTSSPTPTPSPAPITRNTPSVIKARLTAVTISSLVSCATFPFVLPAGSAPAITALGLSLAGRTPVQLLNLLVLPLGLTAVLFAGPLYIAGLEGDLPGTPGWSWQKTREEHGGLMGLRTYFVGPLTEELVFRSCIVAVSLLAGFSKKEIVFLTPLYFGFAHVHHAWGVYVAGGKTKLSLQRGILSSTLQLGCTTLFGWYATFLFMRTGSLLPPFLAHTFCNFMGLPPIDYALRVYPERRAIIWGSHLAGIAGFIYGFWRLTEPALFGGSLYWV